VTSERLDPPDDDEHDGEYYAEYYGNGAAEEARILHGEEGEEA